MEKIFKAKTLEDLDRFIFRNESHDHRVYEDYDFYYYISDYDYHICPKWDSRKTITISRDYYYQLFKDLRNQSKLEIKDNEFFSKDHDIPIVKPNKIKDRVFIFYKEPLDIIVQNNDYMQNIYERLKKKIFSTKKGEVLSSINNEIFLTKKTYEKLDDITLNELHFLKNLRDVVNEILVYDVKEENKLLTEFIIKEIQEIKVFDDLFAFLYNPTKNRISIKLEEYLKRGKGVCKQFALLYGYLLESLSDDFLLAGNFSLDLYLINDYRDSLNLGHIWVRYESLENKVFILDQRYILELFSNTERQIGQHYNTPNEFEEYIKRRIKNKYYSV
ncbi:MAG: hypothetical protein QW210_01200 [Candidatus Woesearchaeota archaeon]